MIHYVTHLEPKLHTDRTSSSSDIPQSLVQSRDKLSGRSFRGTPTGNGTGSGTGSGANKWRQIVLVQSIVRNLAHESLDKISPNTPRNMRTAHAKSHAHIHKNSNSSNQNLTRLLTMTYYWLWLIIWLIITSTKRNSQDDCARFLNNIRSSQNSGNFYES